MERAENLARILDINETYARDNPDGPDWRRVLQLYSDEKRFLSLDREPDARNVLHFYILDRSNPTSITAGLAQARENARSMRHLLSTEMWRHLNEFYSNVVALKVRDIGTDTLSKTARKIITECQTFEGIAEGTFFRGESWNFYHLGKYMERGDQTTRVLDMGYQRLSLKEGDALDWVHWNVLLRSVSGYHAFCSRYPESSSPSDIAEFLLKDTEFPRAVSLCIARVDDRLSDIERRHGSRRPKDIEAARKRVEELVEGGVDKELTARRLHQHLDSVQTAFAELSLAIRQAYFDLELA